MRYLSLSSGNAICYLHKMLENQTASTLGRLSPDKPTLNIPSIYHHLFELHIGKFQDSKLIPLSLGWHHKQEDKVRARVAGGLWFAVATAFAAAISVPFRAPED